MSAHYHKIAISVVVVSFKMKKKAKQNFCSVNHCPTTKKRVLTGPNRSCFNLKMYCIMVPADMQKFSQNVLRIKGDLCFKIKL